MRTLRRVGRYGQKTNFVTDDRARQAKINEGTSVLAKEVDMPAQQRHQPDPALRRRLLPSPHPKNPSTISSSVAQNDTNTFRRRGLVASHLERKQPMIASRILQHSGESSKPGLVPTIIPVSIRQIEHSIPHQDQPDWNKDT